jgi:hypothetical protein
VVDLGPGVTDVGREIPGPPRRKHTRMPADTFQSDSDGMRVVTRPSQRSSDQATAVGHENSMQGVPEGSRPRPPVST